MERPGRIAIEVDGPVATVRIDNASHRNAVDSAMWRALAAAAADIAARSEIRSVVLRGAGDLAFCAGADVVEFDTQRTGAEAAAYDDLVEGTCRSIEALPQPTLAVLRGACVGAGNSLAASCDLRVASDDAYFAHPAARLGLGYDQRGLARLAGVYGMRATRAMILFAARLPALRAQALGAIDEVVPAAALDARVRDLAAESSRNAPLTLRAAKAALRALAPPLDARQLEALLTLSHAADASADYREGLLAFREKRAPRFEGR